jgi:hypothetical protein
MMESLRCMIAAALAVSLAAVAAPAASAGEDEWDKEWDEPKPEDGKSGGEAEAEAAEPAAPESSAGGGDFSMARWLKGVLEWGGYYENQLMVGRLPRNVSSPGESGWKVTDTNKLRLDIKARPGKPFMLDADIILKTYHGTTSYSLRDLLPEKFEPELAFWETSDPSSVRWTMDDEFYLDNAYLTIALDWFRLRIGRQQIRFGSGWFWNPTDLFTVKDLLDPAYEKRGLTAVKIQFFFGHESQMDLYYFLENGFEKSMKKAGFMEGSALGLLDQPSFAVRLRKAFYRWDVAAFIMKKDARIVMSSPAPEAPAVIPDLGIDDRMMGGLEFAGELGGVGLRGEVAVNRIGHDIRFIETLAGIDYTFRGGFSLTAEYFFTSRGKGDSSRYTFEDWINYLTQSIKYPGMHYAAAMIAYTFARINLDLQLAGIVNASEGSFVISPWISYKWGNYVTLSLYGAVSWGNDDTDELRSMGQGAFLRFRFSYY